MLRCIIQAQGWCSELKSVQERILTLITMNERKLDTVAQILKHLCSDITETSQEILEKVYYQVKIEEVDNLWHS